MCHGAVASVSRGIRRTVGTAQNVKAPMLVEVCAQCGEPSPGHDRAPDRVPLPIGFAGAFRRSELVALNAEDVQFTSDGLVVTLRRSKTDQGGEGRKVGIPYGLNPETCPVGALKAWTDAVGIETGALFRPVTRHRDNRRAHVRLQPSRWS